MDTPKVSTVTSCYRADKYIKRFLEELPQQTFFEHTQFVMDHNEPSDYELNCVRDFQEKHPGKLKHLIRDTVVPYGVSINTCFEAADAQFLAIWNMDDLRTPDSLEKQYAAICDNSEIGVVYGDTYAVSAFGEKKGVKSSAPLAPEERFRSFVCGPHFMFRKSLCEKVGLYDEQFISGADFDFCIRLAFYCDFKYLATPTGYFLSASEGLSTRPNSTQPVERTVIELRYGIYDKIQYGHLAAASSYTIPYLLQKGEWVHIRQFVPEWQELLQENSARWLAAGLVKSSALAVKAQTKNQIRRFIGDSRYFRLKSLYASIKKKLDIR
ncbi:MAG: hypothetical protein DELT_01095 [Desulfovibrio sp.]